MVARWMARSICKCCRSISPTASCCAAASCRESIPTCICVWSGWCRNAPLKNIKAYTCPYGVGIPRTLATCVRALHDAVVPMTCLMLLSNHGSTLVAGLAGVLASWACVASASDGCSMSSDGAPASTSCMQDTSCFKLRICACRAVKVASCCVLACVQGGWGGLCLSQRCIVLPALCAVAMCQCAMWRQGIFVQVSGTCCLVPGM